METFLPRPPRDPGVTMNPTPLYPLNHPAIAGLLPRRADDKPVSNDTVRGWITDGATSRTGDRVKLIAQRIGGRWYCTEAAVRGFLEACNAPTAHASQIGELVGVC